MPDVIGTGHITYGIEGTGKHMLQGNNVSGHCCGRVG